MIKDLNTISSDQLQPYDLCIIGTGPAGITLGAELADSNLRICLLESGGVTKNLQADELKEVISDGILIRDNSRERVLGGTSSTWTGLSAPLDNTDMTDRPFLSVPGWPISREELMPYWGAAARYRFPSIAVFEKLDKHGTGSWRARWKKIHEKVFLETSPAQHFGKEWNDILQRGRVDVLCNATVVGFKRLGVSPAVDRVMVMSSNNECHTIQAKAFVLAAGAIENTRILLSSNLGNEHDQVGRYFMNHPKGNYGIIKLNQPLKDDSYFWGSLQAGHKGYYGLRLSEPMQISSGVLNSYIRLEPILPWADKKFNIRTIIQYIYFKLTGNKPPIKTIRLRSFMEMEPHSENRIILSPEKDRYGQSIPKVHHDSTELDRRSLVELHKVLKEELRASDAGELIGDLGSEAPWPINQDASHHLGGTRMGTDPRTSVVNENLRLHTVDNLYCAGGSVFSTSGCANPTFTICALSIRLAEHLKRVL